LARSEGVPAAFTRYVERERRAQRFIPELKPLMAGAVTSRLRIGSDDVSGLAVEAAKRAAGFFRPTRRTEVVWVDGESELAVGLAGVRVETGDGAVVVTIPVRCDQTGETEVHVTFAVGRPGQPAGLYAATQRRPRGPAVVVDTWAEAIVAFAWQILLGLATGLACATGKDARGNRLVPAELEATSDGLTIVPMARHRFAGSPGLAGAVTRR
jgi:hypothetical protein